jgi:hypothetical protein
MENTAKISTAPTTAAVPPPAPQEWIFEIAESARRAENNLQEYIGKNPVKSVAIAMGLGFAVHLILKSIPARQEQV